MSPFVQASESSHAAVLGAKSQPVAGMQLSFVHRFVSSQTIGAPGTHDPAAQMSPFVQASESSHAAVLGAKSQPVAGMQLSFVHAFKSSHDNAPEPTHIPAPSHVSVVVHMSTSSQLLPDVSKKHALSQQSPETVLPSSQSSPTSTVPFPHTASRNCTAMSTRVREKESPLSGFVTWGAKNLSQDTISSGVRVGTASRRSAACPAA